MATVLSLKILDNGDQLKAQCETKGALDFVEIQYYRENDLLARVQYYKTETLVRVFADIENMFAQIV